VGAIYDFSKPPGNCTQIIVAVKKIIHTSHATLEQLLNSTIKFRHICENSEAFFKRLLINKKINWAK
jgi:hypothetical protein